MNILDNIIRQGMRWRKRHDSFGSDILRVQTVSVSHVCHLMKARPYPCNIVHSDNDSLFVLVRERIHGESELGLPVLQFVDLFSHRFSGQKIRDDSDDLLAAFECRAAGSAWIPAWSVGTNSVEDGIQAIETGEMLWRHESVFGTILALVFNLLTQHGSISVRTLVAVGLPQVSQIMVSSAEMMAVFLGAGTGAGACDMTDPCVPAILLIEDAAEWSLVFNG